MAIDHKEPDRIPVDFWWSQEMRDKLLDRLKVEGVDDLQHYLGSDIRCIYWRYVGPKLKRFEDGRNWL